MIKFGEPRIMRAAPLLIAISTILIIALTGCGAQTRPVTDQFDLPGDWIQSASDVMRGDQEISSNEVGMRLEANGTAEVWNLPTGVEKKTDTYVCFARSGETYSGGATWSASDSGVLRIKYDSDETIFWGDPGKFGSMDWRNLVLADCEESGQANFRGPSRHK